MSTSRLRAIAASIALFLVSLLVALGLGEGVVRLSNTSMQSYDIEMWRYARELKLPSDNPVLGHEHVNNASSTLQSVEIRFNNMGLRGPPVSVPLKADRRILFLGSSVTLGWGVAEQDTVTARLERMFAAAGQQVAVLNAGIGNYNAERYVERYLTRLIALEPTDIVLHAFVNDGEILKPGGANFLIRNSQLAATVWILASRMLGETGEEGLTQPGLFTNPLAVDFSACDASLVAGSFAAGESRVLPQLCDSHLRHERREEAAVEASGTATGDPAVA